LNLRNGIQGLVDNQQCTVSLAPLTKVVRRHVAMSPPLPLLTEPSQSHNVRHANPLHPHKLQEAVGQIVFSSLQVLSTAAAAALLPRHAQAVVGDSVSRSSTMIRDGKAEGWLKLPTEALLPWALLNHVAFNRVVPGVAVGRGGALLASRDLSDGNDDEDGTLMTVPGDLILSLEHVLEHAKVDKDFREVLDSLGDFGRVGLILLFPLSLSV